MCIPLHLACYNILNIEWKLGIINGMEKMYCHSGLSYVCASLCMVKKNTHGRKRSQDFSLTSKKTSSPTLPIFYLHWSSQPIYFADFHSSAKGRVDVGWDLWTTITQTYSTHNTFTHARAAQTTKWFITHWSFSWSFYLGGWCVHVFVTITSTTTHFHHDQTATELE